MHEVQRVYDHGTNVSAYQSFAGLEHVVEGRARLTEGRFLQGVVLRD